MAILPELGVRPRQRQRGADPDRHLGINGEDYDEECENEDESPPPRLPVWRTLTVEPTDRQRRHYHDPRSTEGCTVRALLD